MIFNVDIAPRLITAVVDGVLCDGGDHAQYGYTRYADAGPNTGNAPHDIHAGPLRVAAEGADVQRVRCYNRALTTTEMVGNFRAGP